MSPAQRGVSQCVLHAQRTRAHTHTKERAFVNSNASTAAEGTELGMETAAATLGGSEEEWEKKMEMRRQGHALCFEALRCIPSTARSGPSSL